MNNIPLTIKETQEGLKSKKFSAVELVDSYLAQIKKYNDEQENKKDIASTTDCT